MPWTTPETFTAGQTLTAASMNALSENVDFLREGRPGAVTPMCIAQLTSSQSIANFATTANNIVTFASKTVETDSGMYGANKIVIKTAGVYMVSAMVMWEPNANGIRYMAVRKNGVGGADNLNAAINHAVHPNGTNRVSQNISAPLSLAVNDELDLVLTQNSGGSLTINNYPPQTFSAVWIGKE